jgi:sphingolipid delta-4 desaturase
MLRKGWGNAGCLESKLMRSFQINSTGFTVVDTPEPHSARRKQLLARHPELRELFGNTPSTALHIFCLVSAQIAIGEILRNESVWILLLASWCLGALLNHALWVMIHDSTHNLILKGSVGNRCMGMLSNLPLIFPAAMGFRTYHLLHHRYQGELNHDADLPGPVEAKLVGTSSVRKVLWLMNFWLIEGIVRPARLVEVKLLNRWFFTNLIVQIAFCTAIIGFFGWRAMLYLFFSVVFSIGLHPVGARWIQEHYLIVPGQETYSYYGPLNWLCYNVGYHNEHHDLMRVPWSRLKKVKQLAPEFYESLYFHKSWSKLLFKFIFDRSLNLHSRAVRPSGTTT